MFIIKKKEFLSLIFHHASTGPIAMYLVINNRSVTNAIICC